MSPPSLSGLQASASTAFASACITQHRVWGPSCWPQSPGDSTTALDRQPAKEMVMGANPLVAAAGPLAIVAMQC